MLRYTLTLQWQDLEVLSWKQIRKTSWSEQSHTQDFLWVFLSFSTTEKYFFQREWNGHWGISLEWKVNAYTLKGMLHGFFDQMWLLTQESWSDGNWAEIYISEGNALWILWPNVNLDLIMNICLQSSLKSFITIQNQALGHGTEVEKVKETH